MSAVRIHLCLTEDARQSHVSQQACRIRALISKCLGIAQQVSLVDCPSSADIIVFAFPLSPTQEDVRECKIYKRFAAKSLVVDQSDHAIPTVRGLYTNIPDWLVRFPIFQSTFYFRVDENPFCPENAPFHEADLLFSFVGNTNNYSRVRKRLLKLKDTRSLIIENNNPLPSPDARFGEVLRRSKFVLCPRGKCPSSFRLFETMRAGRVPVIISDEWRPFGHLPWEKFSISIPESQTHEIPKILEFQEQQAEEMGRVAYQTYEQNFSHRNAAGFLLRQFEEVLAAADTPSRSYYWRKIPQQVYKAMTRRLPPEILKRQIYAISKL